MRFFSKLIHPFGQIIYLLKSRIFSSNSRTCSSYSNCKVSSKSNVATADNAKLENLCPIGFCLGSSSCDSSLVKNWWRLNGQSFNNICILKLEKESDGDKIFIWWQNLP